MAKIKFNLNFGGEQIRTLDDLRENFSIEDILDVFNNGMLVKWLDVRNHKDELAKVKAIQATDARSILSELIQIFGVTSDESELQESLSVLDYLEGRKRFWADIKAGKLDEVSQQQGKEKILLNYHEGYKALVQDIISHPDDLQYIYDRLDALAANYSELIKLDYINLFNRFYDEAPLAVLALYGHNGTRPFYALNEGELKIDHSEERTDILHRYNVAHFYPANEKSYYDQEKKEFGLSHTWKVIVRTDSFDEDLKIPSTLSEKLRLIDKLYELIYAENTDKRAKKIKSVDKSGQYIKKFEAGNKRKDWHEIEASGKKYLLFLGYLYWTVSHEEFAVAAPNDYKHYYDVNYLSLVFPVLDGIEARYSSGCSSAYFYYMEAR